MKNILVFNDISGLGNCSMSANIAVLSRMGHNVMPVITSAFSCQTGFDGFKFITNGCTESFTRSILANRDADAVYLGFCPDAESLHAAASAVRLCDRDTRYFMADPIMGDNGSLYPVFGRDYVETMKKAIEGADCITPNLTEACLLADLDFMSVTADKDRPDYLPRCAEIFHGFAQKTNVKSAVITGVDFGAYVANMVLEGETVRFVTNDRTDINYSGTGDVFSSVLLGDVMNGAELYQATEKAARFVCSAASATREKDRRFGTEFCRVLKFLD